MNPADKYEHPQPIMYADVDSLVIETKGNHAGAFLIKNTGGGVLAGRILSRCAGLTFEPAEFEGNNQEINYTFDAQAAGLGIGDAVSTRFFITTNGGEKEIPVSAKLTKMSITTPEGHTIANIRDFYEYAPKYPAQARRLFTSGEFYMLLLASGYEYPEVYESLHKDANRERAMDNFFILSGLKNRTGLSILSPCQIEFSQKPHENDMLFGSIKVAKTDGGYVSVPVTKNSAADWLTLSAGNLTTADFDENNTASINFNIDPTRIKTDFTRELVQIGDDTTEIIYRRQPLLSLKLNRETYRYADKGTIEVINNTGSNMQVAVFCPENYIRFAARSFPIGQIGEIPFDIKLSTFINAQMLFRKLPFMHTLIEVRAKIPGNEYKKTLPITVGEW
ncbi:MAG: DUF5717 family protein [Defluviitaleaceae bacterium]|nr:DUF5717 family protein [Defluviitaleaceae bacterium]